MRTPAFDALNLAAFFALSAVLQQACAGGWISQDSAAADPASRSNDKDLGKPTETTSTTTTDPSTTTKMPDGAGTGSTCVPLAKYFSDKMFTPIMSTTCAVCHTSSTVPSFPMDGGVDKTFAATTAMAKTMAGGASALIANPTAAVKHGGGKVFAADSSEAKTFAAFIAAVAGGKDCAVPPTS